MRFPWQNKAQRERAERDCAKARTDYEWAVAQRTTVSDIVQRIIQHGEQNNVIENLLGVTRGGHK